MSNDLPEVGREEIPNFYAEDVDDFSPEYLDNKLGEVVDKIRSRWGSLVAQRLASGALTQRLYKGTVVRVAGRVFSNTEGYRRENAGQAGYELNPAVASGTIWFTDDDIEDLTGVRPKQSSVFGTATIGRHHPGRTR